MKMPKRLMTGLVLLGSTALFASDDPFDGTRTLLCAASDSIQCTEVEGCDANPPDANNMPRFLRIDVPNKTASAVWPAGLDKTSRISSVVVGDLQLVLQGIDGEVPWSAAIDKASGHVAVSQSRGNAGFLIFGTCMPE